MENFSIDFAREQDVGVIRQFIWELAEYEKLLDQMEATEEGLTETIFREKYAEVLIAREDGYPVGFALFFHNYSTFLGKPGLYLEDLFVRPQWRGKGYGKALLSRLAEIAVERDCGRMEWSCLDWNQPSIDVYLSLGAKPMDGWHVYRLTGDELRQLAGKA